MNEGHHAEKEKGPGVERRMEDEARDEKGRQPENRPEEHQDDASALAGLVEEAGVPRQC